MMDEITQLNAFGMCAHLLLLSTLHHASRVIFYNGYL